MTEKDSLLLLQSVGRKLLERASDITKYKKSYYKV